MEINNIGSTGSIQPTSNTKKVEKVSQTSEISAKDNIDLSTGGKTQALYNKAIDVVSMTPDIRMDKVEEAKKLLESFKNPSDDILEAVSKKLLSGFDIT